MAASEAALVVLGLLQTGLLFRVSRSLGRLEVTAESNEVRSLRNAETLRDRLGGDES